MKSQCECAVNDPAVDVDAKVNFHNVLLLQHDILLTRVGRIMCDFMVEAETGGEAHHSLDAISRLQSGMTQQRSYTILDPFGDVQKGRA